MLASKSHKTKGTFILIHGTNVGGWNWYKIVPLLEAQGYTAISFDLPAMGIDRTPIKNVTLQTHVNKVLEILDSLSEPAFVVGHSYGGAVLSEVCEARPDKVKKAIYLAGLMLQDGQIVLEANAQDPWSETKNNSIIEYGQNGERLTILLNPNATKELLCNDGCSVKDINLIQSLLKSQPASTFIAPISIGANFSSVPKAYISTLDDKTVPTKFQEIMYSEFPETDVIKIKGCHMVILTRPKKIVKILTSLDN